jgi:tRNA C32,U32 (ribose-2'-O)-methylase TrmJ
MSDSVSERTTINLTISSWWHVAVIIAVIVGCYFGLKSDTNEALAMSKATAADERATQEKVNSMQMDIRSVADDVKWFRGQYERDMNRFIREQPEKNR